VAQQCHAHTEKGPICSPGTDGQRQAVANPCGEQRGEEGLFGWRGEWRGPWSWWLGWAFYAGVLTVSATTVSSATTILYVATSGANTTNCTSACDAGETT
jgi:hypothetical protein